MNEKEKREVTSEIMTHIAIDLIDEGKSPEYVIQFLIDNAPVHFSDSEKHSIAIQALRGAAQQ